MPRSEVMTMDEPLVVTARMTRERSRDLLTISSRWMANQKRDIVRPSTAAANMAVYSRMVVSVSVYSNVRSRKSGSAFGL